METESLEKVKSSSGFRPGIIIWLIVSQGMSLLSLLPWLVIAGLSVMAFDSGVSTEAVLFVGFIWSYPFFVIGLAIAAWVLFVYKKIKAALIVTSLPLIPALALLIYIGWMWFSNILG
ncbi:MAG: hypothetical protein LWX83_14735 [Anaerolineae bacterium]|nr:hypothetical protein [Anaerolineae bacterium]